MSFHSKPALNFHTKRVHLKVKNCHCDYCGYACLGKETMRHHMITHVELENRIKYPCHLCSVICISINGYHTHVKNVHGERKIHDCPECERKFTTSTGMKEHIKSFHRHEKFECPICNRFFSKHSIGRHNRRFHGILYVSININQFKLTNYSCLFSALEIQDYRKFKISDVSPNIINIPLILITESNRKVKEVRLRNNQQYVLNVVSHTIHNQH